MLRIEARGCWIAGDESWINASCGTIPGVATFPFMSRAFVKEPDGAEAQELPDRPISEHPNLVTPQGLAQIEETLTRLHEQHAQIGRAHV